MSRKSGYSALDAGTGDGERTPLVGRGEGSGISTDGVYIKEGRQTSKRLLAGLLLIVFVCAAIGAGVALGIIYGTPSKEEPSEPVGYFFSSAVVAADAQHCSEIGRNMLMNGGGAIDAAIAGLLCVGLYNSHSAGIGGGSFILYYDRDSQNATFLDAREMAPGAATTDMYQNESSDASTTGGLAIAVPGEIKGYWEAHQRFGKLPWADLFAPAIELAENGYTVLPPLATAISSQQDRILADPSLSAVFTDGEGNILLEGDTVLRPQLAQTMRTIASDGVDAFYKGQMAEDIVAEIQARGGIITSQDLANYEVADRTPISIDIDDLKAFTGPPPCSGPVFALILNILEGYKLTPESIQALDDEVLTYHRIIEAFKFGYAKRSGLGDGSFVNLTELVANMTSQEYADGLRAKINDDRTYNYTYYDPFFQIVSDSGTSHISILDQFGNAASITSTVNTYFGSKVRGETTGIIYNNEMDDFSKPGEPNFYGVPPSEPNFIKPGKRPLSSMSPVILADGNGDVRFVAGASGGTRITTAVSLVTVFNQWLGDSLPDSIERRRLHHQLVPEYPIYEPDFPMAIIDGLRKKLHKPEESSSFSVVQAIRRHTDDLLEGYCDSRKAGKPAGF